MVDEYCAVKLLDHWQHRTKPRAAVQHPNDVRSSWLRYDNYLDQVACLSRHTEALFEKMRATGLYESAVIPVPGPVGSRIYQNRPRADTASKLRAADYGDVVSTLLAVKMPGIALGYAAIPVGLPGLLKELANSGFYKLPQRCEHVPRVHLLTDDPDIRLPAKPPGLTGGLATSP